MARKKTKAPQLDESFNESISIKEGFGDAHGGENKNHEEPSLNKEKQSVETSEPNDEIVHDENFGEEEEQTTDDVTVKETGFKGKIKPEYDVIKGLIDSINQYYDEEIGDLKRYKEFETTRKNWEKQARGACEMIVSKVNSDHFDVNDPYKCSPLAYSKIKNSDSRDLSVLDLAGAVIVFYNSIASETKEFGESTQCMPFDDYSEKIVKVKDGLYEYEKPCKNNSLLVEGSFSRLYNILKDDVYAVLSAYRKKFTKEENIKRNQLLKAVLNHNKMGVYQLVGHWREGPDGKDYLETEEKDLVDTIERSYVVKKPKDTGIDAFKNFIMACLSIEGESQDCAIIHLEDDTWIGITPSGEEFPIGEKLTLNKVAQAYSQWVKKTNLPFVFEFVESPASNSGKLLYTKHNIKYLT